MDLYSVLMILCVSVAGTAAMTWVPAYRKGVRAGVLEEKNRNKALYGRGQTFDINTLYPRYTGPVAYLTDIKPGVISATIYDQEKDSDNG